MCETFSKKRGDVSEYFTENIWNERIVDSCQKISTLSSPCKSRQRREFCLIISPLGLTGALFSQLLQKPHEKCVTSCCVMKHSHIRVFCGGLLLLQCQKFGSAQFTAVKGKKVSQFQSFSGRLLCKAINYNLLQIWNGGAQHRQMKNSSIKYYFFWLACFFLWTSKTFRRFL